MKTRGTSCPFSTLSEVLSLKAMFPSTPTLKLIALAALACLLGALGIVAFGGSSQTRLVVQLLVLPCVLAVFSRIAIWSVRLPRIIVGIVVVAALTGAVVRYRDVTLLPGSLLLSRFENDRLGTQTTIVRDRIRSVVGERAVSRVGAHEKVVQSAEDALEVLDDHPKVLGVVWGSERWLNVSLRVPEPFSLATLPKESLGGKFLAEHGVSDLKLITGVPRIGLSQSLDFNSARFIGLLIDPLNAFVGALQSPDESPQFEREVREAAAVKSTWTSFAHRALPMWMTGTYHLVRGLRSSEQENGDFACALASFRAAKSNLRGDNPALEAAILNNEAVLRLVRADTGLDMREQRVIARDALFGAARLRNARDAASDESHVLGVIKSNIEVVRMEQKRGREGEANDD
jgi:hypothetical protein